MATLATLAIDRLWIWLMVISWILAIVVMIYFEAKGVTCSESEFTKAYVDDSCFRQHNASSALLFLGLQSIGLWLPYALWSWCFSAEIDERIDDIHIYMKRVKDSSDSELRILETKLVEADRSHTIAAHDEDSFVTFVTTSMCHPEQTVTKEEEKEKEKEKEEQKDQKGSDDLVDLVVASEHHPKKEQMATAAVAPIKMATAAQLELNRLMIKRAHLKNEYELRKSETEDRVETHRPRDFFQEALMATGLKFGYSNREDMPRFQHSKSRCSRHRWCWSYWLSSLITFCVVLVALYYGSKGLSEWDLGTARFQCTFEAADHTSFEIQVNHTSCILGSVHLIRHAIYVDLGLLVILGLHFLFKIYLMRETWSGCKRPSQPIKLPENAVHCLCMVKSIKYLDRLFRHLDKWNSPFFYACYLSKYPDVCYARIPTSTRILERIPIIATINHSHPYQLIQ